jgi:hypothetical protein
VIGSCVLMYAINKLKWKINFLLKTIEMSFTDDIDNVMNCA